MAMVTLQSTMTTGYSVSSTNQNSEISSGIINQEIIEKVKRFVENNFDAIDRLFSFNIDHVVDNKYTVYQGKHSSVFSHTEFPGLIFKIMDKETAINSKQSLDLAQKIFEENQYAFCHAPQAEIVMDLPHNSCLFLMEKAKGTTDELCAQKEMEEEFEFIHTDLKIAAKWKKMTREVAEGIAKLGYWDITLANLLWDSKNGFDFVDFEGVEPTNELIREGLDRLVHYLPPQYVDEIYNVAAENNVVLPESEEAAKANRLTKFQRSRHKNTFQNFINENHPIYKGLNQRNEKVKVILSSWDKYEGSGNYGFFSFDFCDSIVIKFRDNRDREVLVLRVSEDFQSLTILDKFSPFSRQPLGTLAIHK